MFRRGGRGGSGEKERVGVLERKGGLGVTEGVMVGKDEGGAPGDYCQSFMNDSAPLGLGQVVRGSGFRGARESGSETAVHKKHN